MCAPKNLTILMFAFCYHNWHTSCRPRRANISNGHTVIVYVSRKQNKKKKQKRDRHTNTTDPSMCDVLQTDKHFKWWWWSLDAVLAVMPWWSPLAAGRTLWNCIWSFLTSPFLSIIQFKHYLQICFSHSSILYANQQDPTGLSNESHLCMWLNLQMSVCFK